MITLTREEAQQVLDAMQNLLDRLSGDFCDENSLWDEYQEGSDAEQTLRARLSEPEPEPVAWDEVMQHYCYLLDNLGDLPIPDFRNWAHKQWEKGSALLDANDYFRTAPPQREWQGLTDEDRQELAAEQYGWEGLCSAVEAKLREKNA
jgi:hypothetical protein